MEEGVSWLFVRSLVWQRMLKLKLSLFVSDIFECERPRKILNYVLWAKKERKEEKEKKMEEEEEICVIDISFINYCVSKLIYIFRISYYAFLHFRTVLPNNNFIAFP